MSGDSAAQAATLIAAVGVDQQIPFDEFVRKYHSIPKPIQESLNLASSTSYARHSKMKHLVSLCLLIPFRLS